MGWTLCVCERAVCLWGVVVSPLSMGVVAVKQCVQGALLYAPVCRGCVAHRCGSSIARMGGAVCHEGGAFPRVLKETFPASHSQAAGRKKGHLPPDCPRGMIWLAAPLLCWGLAVVVGRERPRPWGRKASLLECDLSTEGAGPSRC
ncbi:hypothetical protein AAFF_G00248380 [Aldrovandia affinis]|uniref:Uncharacterized protein n=1 Tax=Aldrovandia affinis TaxID=143900 RepID=A0AAD7W2U7_9TELE|nr:hypothetical protein AAFF_G00248380 [Aldrovandia affinis]